MLKLMFNSFVGACYRHSVTVQAQACRIFSRFWKEGIVNMDQTNCLKFLYSVSVLVKLLAVKTV